MSNPYGADIGLQPPPPPSPLFPPPDDVGSMTTLMTSTSYGVAVSALSFLAFVVVGGFVGRIPPPKSAVTSSNRWKWKNIAVSLVHSSAIGVGSAISFVVHPEMMDDLIEFNNPFIYTIASISTGYFLYDFYDVVANGQSRDQWEVLLHHVAVLNSFLYNVIQCRFIGYTMVALIVELNTIFLHVRKLLQMRGHFDYNSATYRIVRTVNLVTFVLCRFAFSLFLITCAIIFHADKMSSYYYWSLMTTIWLSWIVNVILFIRLVKSDVLRRRRRPQRSRDDVMTSSRDDLVTSLLPSAEKNGYISHDDDRHQNNNSGFKPKRL